MIHTPGYCPATWDSTAALRNIPCKERMAENSGAVYKLLDQLLDAYTPTAKQE
ncbi:MAG: hypothetical protein ACLVEU_06655 [Bacteroides cellulosilyticus]